MLNQFPLNYHQTNMSNSMPGSHKASLIGNSHGIDVASSVSYPNSNSKVAALHHQQDSSGQGTPSGQQNGTYYLNKLRQQEQQQNVIRHNGMLENINRPSSRQGVSRKGMRSRKANTNGLASNPASHSQDSRPTLPQVQSHANASGAKMGNTTGKLNYNTLVDP